MILAIQVALAVDLALVLLHGTIPSLSKLLPLGGSHIAQLGAVFAATALVVEIGAILRATQMI
ncbi:MAG: hypothetical protein JSR60_16545 [Proteobacteria bacterium]|nr:hypothetical protein [Pseudomonadota bacterium]